MGSRVGSSSFSSKSNSGRKEFLAVQVGRVEAESLPWTFSAKVDDVPGARFGGQPPVKCELVGAAHLPVAALFEEIAFQEDGKFRMAFLGGGNRKSFYVELRFMDGQDVATFVKQNHTIKHREMSKKLPQFDKFLNSGMKSVLPHPQPEPQPLLNLVTSRTSAIPGCRELMNRSDNKSDTYSSHQSPMYSGLSNNVMTKYVEKQREMKMSVAGIPDMKSDPKLKPPQMRRRTDFPLELLMASGRSSSRHSEMSSNHEESYEQLSRTITPSPQQPIIVTPPMLSPALNYFNFRDPIPSTNCTITHVVALDEFYVLPCSELSTLATMEKQLSAKYSRSPFTELPRKWRNLAVGVHIQGRWHRAEVKRAIAEHSFELFLVDVGKFETVYEERIRVLDHDDVKLPVQTVCCAMRGVGKGSPEEAKMLEGLGKVKATFISRITDFKFSTILEIGTGHVVNQELGSNSLEKLKFYYNDVAELKFEKGKQYEVKWVGQWGRSLHVVLKDNEKALAEIDAQLRSIDYSITGYLPKVGEYVVVFKVPELRRAKIVDVKGSSVRAYIVDSGVFKDVSNLAMQPLAEHYLLTPAVATMCILAEPDILWPKNELKKVLITGYENNIPVLAVVPVETKIVADIQSRPWVESRLAASFPGFQQQPVQQTSLASVPKFSPSHLHAATIVSVYSSSMFFVHLDAQRPAYMHMEAELSQASLHPAKFPLEKGDVCLSHYNGRWLRAEILSADEVLFLDYGFRAKLERPMALNDMVKRIEPAAILCRAAPELTGLKAGMAVQIQMSGGMNKIVALGSVKLIESAPPAVDAPDRLVTAPAVKEVVVGSYCSPWQVWLVSEPDVLQEMCERLEAAEDSEQFKDFVLREVYACKTQNGWFRGVLDNLEPPSAYLIDLGYSESKILQVRPLSGINKHVPPLAKSYDLFEGEVSSRVDSKLARLLESGTKVEALIDDEDSKCVVWIDKENVLLSSGHMVKVEVSHVENDGSIWLTRMSKALRRTEKLQAVAPSLDSLDRVEVGAPCVARDMADNTWYRAEVIGRTRFFHTVRLVDFGRLGEATELKNWWSKEEKEAKFYKSLKQPGVLGDTFLVLKSDWRDEDVAPVYNDRIERIDA